MTITARMKAMYPTTDQLRNAYGEIMYWADLRFSQTHHAQQCIETCERIKHKPDPEDVRRAGDFNGEDLLMAAAIVAKLGGFETEHQQHREALYKRHWGDPDEAGRWHRSPWDAYGRAGMGLSA